MNQIVIKSKTVPNKNTMPNILYKLEYLKKKYSEA